MEDDYYEVSPVISVFPPPVKLSLPARYAGPPLMLAPLPSSSLNVSYLSFSLFGFNSLLCSRVRDGCFFFLFFKVRGGGALVLFLAAQNDRLILGQCEWDGEELW